MDRRIEAFNIKTELARSSIWLWLNKVESVSEWYKVWMEWNWGSDERPWVYYGGLFWGKQVLLHIRWYAAPVYWELCYGFAVGLRGMNLESGNFKAMRRLGNEVCRMMQLKDEGILILEVMHVKLTYWHWAEYRDVLKPWVTGYWKPSTETIFSYVDIWTKIQL